MLGLLCTIYLVGAVFTPMAGPRIDRRGDRTKVISGLSVFCTGILIAQSMASSFSGSAADDATAVGLCVTACCLGGSFGSALNPGATVYASDD
jgi:MFS family permease